MSNAIDRRWIALVVFCVGMLMIVLDQTIVNVALPSIQRDLGFTTSNLAWVVNAYLIAFGGLLLLAGRMGDLIGLLMGGVLTQALNWHWIFFVNLPIGAAAAIFATRFVDGQEGIGLRKGADVSGALLVTGALMLGVYTILEVDRYGWGSAHTLGLGAVSLGLLAGFVARQARAATPLMPKPWI